MHVGTEKSFYMILIFMGLLLKLCRDSVKVWFLDHDVGSGSWNRAEMIVGLRPKTEKILLILNTTSSAGIKGPVSELK